MTLALMLAGGAAVIAIVAALLFGTSTEVPPAPTAAPGVQEQLGGFTETPVGPTSSADIRKFLRNKRPLEQDCLVEEYRERFTDEQLGRIVNLGRVSAEEVAEMEAAAAVC